jgi:ribosomal RNA-processing protein 12
MGQSSKKNAGDSMDVDEDDLKQDLRASGSGQSSGRRGLGAPKTSGAPGGGRIEKRRNPGHAPRGGNRSGWGKKR